MGYKRFHRMEEIADPAPFLKAARRAAERWSDRVAELARELSPVAVAPEGLSATGFAGSRGRPPGTLKASWHALPVVMEGQARFRASAGSNDPIAVYVEYSTAPHVIRPRADRQAASVVSTKKARGSVQDGRAALRFFVGGRVVYARTVHHPGTRGQYVLHRAVAGAMADLDRFLREELEAAMGESRYLVAA